MKADELDAEVGFREAREQWPRRRAGADRWTSRAAFWTAVRFGPALEALAVGEARERWAALWAIAVREHLAPIPGAPDVGAPPSVAAAERGLAHMRAIVGSRK
ncbi:hypothetical protein ACKI2N_001910 [Cupriavidus sp. 30B13]|uniref:hypothetical protein n=1 Tax=Cupriavidus sp. 30B13 TaxID=3384241 RepID=UPI003B8F2E11